MEHIQSRVTTASADRIWQVWSNPGTWHEWNPNVREMKMNGPFAVGTTGVMVAQSRSHDIQFTGIDAGKSFSLETRVLPLSTFVFTCRVQPVGDSGSTISQGISMKGPLGGLYSAMMGKQIAKDFTGVLDGLAKKAEAAG
jgi:hypothetical protein